MGRDPEIKIALEGALNTRSLGSYRTEDNEVTSDEFIRSDYLRPLSKSDMDLLLEMGLRHVIDLRSPGEVMALASVWVGAGGLSYHSLPIFGDSEHRDIPAFFEGGARMGDFYIRLVESHKPEFLGIFRTMAGADGKVLFHCSAGKDRTGIVASLLLRLAGVGTKTISADYAITESLIGPFLRRHVPQPGAGQAGGEQDELLGSRPESIESLLGHIEERYAGARGYLEHLGMGAGEINGLREKLIAGPKGESR